jgi:hypothetical protein
MNSALPPKPGLIWLKRQNYKIVPLNSFLDGSAVKLKQAIDHGVYVRPDSNRTDFYEVEVSDGWAYIHVRDPAQIVYVVAYVDTSGGLSVSENHQDSHPRHSVHHSGMIVTKSIPVSSEGSSPAGA